MGSEMCIRDRVHRKAAVHVDSGFAMNLALIGALILAITRAWGNGVPSFTNLRSKG